MPDPQAAATFERRSCAGRSATTAATGRVLQWYRDLISLRRATPALTDPRLESTAVDADADTGLVVVRRGPIAVVANLGAVARRRPAAGHELVMGSEHDVRMDQDHLVLPVDTVAILKTNR